MDTKELMEAVESVMPDYNKALKIVEENVTVLDETGLSFTPEYMLWFTYIEYRSMMKLLGELDILFTQRFAERVYYAKA
jgi:hypothetical protein